MLRSLHAQDVRAFLQELPRPIPHDQIERLVVLLERLPEATVTRILGLVIMQSGMSENRWPGGFSTLGTTVSPDWVPLAPPLDLRQMGYRHLGVERFSTPASPIHRISVYQNLAFHDALVHEGIVSDEQERHPASEFVLIPPGRFRMGSPANEGVPDEHPQHEVVIQVPFLLARTPVVQAVWKKWGKNLSSPTLPLHPTVKVSWRDVQEWIEEANKNVGLILRLPSEAEWEYACRAGTTTTYFFGNDSDDLRDYAWYLNNSGSHSHEVGELLANAFGLYDMNGNVWEWCQDTYQDSYVGAPTDGSAWVIPGAADRVLRSGSWHDFAVSCRSADRSGCAPGWRSSNLGVRLVQAVSTRDWSFREYYGETEERPPGITTQGYSTPGHTGPRFVDGQNTEF